MLLKAMTAVLLELPVLVPLLNWTVTVMAEVNWMKKITPMKD